jgi:hypothetical protein
MARRRRSRGPFFQKPIEVVAAECVIKYMTGQTEAGSQLRRHMYRRFGKATSKKILDQTRSTYGLLTHQ